MFHKFVKMDSWYNLPLYYDVSFSHEMRDELRFLKTTLHHYCPNKQPKVLEPACGSGRLLVPLSRAGFQCAGFDRNAAALDYLKKN